MIHLAAGGVVIDHFFERRQAAVVHVGRGERDVSQRGRAELADVLGPLRAFKESAIRRRVRAIRRC